MGLLNYLKPKGAKEQGGVEVTEVTNAEPVRRLIQPSSRSKSYANSRRPSMSGMNSPTGYSTPGYATPGATTPGGPNDSRADVRSVRSLAQSEKWEEIDSFRHMTMCDHIYKQQQQNLWIDDRDEYEQGVLLRRQGGGYVASPPGLLQGRFAASVMEMNASSAMTVAWQAITMLLNCRNGRDYIPIRADLRIQVLPDFESLPRAKIHQCAAFIANENILVVWDDSPEQLFKRAQKIVDDLVNLVWNDPNIFTPNLMEMEKGAPGMVSVLSLDQTSAGDDSSVHEVEGAAPIERPYMIYNAIYVSVTIAAIFVFVGFGLRTLVVEAMGDGTYIRFALLVMIPIQIFFSLFFFQVIVGCFAQCIGPIKQMTGNSRFYSGLPPRRITNRILPHVTIQCPVYKEGLEAVIVPTVRSLKAAISTYELQGGTANIFYNDDGLQLIPEDQRQARIDFYADNMIGWTSRPPHGMDGYVRKGKFKKASNMNYGLMLSNQTEELLNQVDRSGRAWTASDEAEAYARCLTQVLANHDGRAWADGNIRIGDYILLVDSDTEVPVDCLLDAVSELENYPQVAILQFASGVMQVAHNYFENGITFFTNLVYIAIRFCVANGDSAPFVGHNAILRWSALQQVSYLDEDNYEKFWSESHVSEDFDMSLRLQCDGYIVRLGAWPGCEGFKEGVSLTVYDELARWEKYAYGCNELLFNPMRYWFTRGPFTKLFRTFLRSNIKFTSKITIISYIGTYYAIGAAWILTVVNYFAVGWFNGYLDGYYLDSWKVWISIIFVFNGLGNISLAMMRHRIRHTSFFPALAENLKWTLLLACFLGGVSLHVSQALLAHMFGINMQWGSTAKELEDSNFFSEVPKILKNFKWTFCFSILCMAAMIILAKGQFIPWDWRITDFVAILPLACVAASHLLLPIVLNPALMKFTF